MKNYTEEQVLQSLRDRAAAKTQKQVATELGFSPSFLNDVIANRRSLTDSLAGSLGFKRVTYYVKKEK